MTPPRAAISTGPRPAPPRPAPPQPVPPQPVTRRTVREPSPPRTPPSQGVKTARTVAANAAPRPTAPAAPYRLPTSGGVRRPGSSLGPLTGLGVALLLSAACVSGALLDFLLVGGPAWALVMLYLGACGFTAVRVRRADWFSALVSPPLTFAAAVTILAAMTPSSLGSGMLGTAATTLTLLAGKAKALYLGTAVSAAVLLGRRIRARRSRAGARSVS